MARVNQSSLKQWADGQTMHGPDYNQERDLLVAAYNDTQDQVTELKGAGGVGTSQLQDNAVTTPKINNGAVTLGKLGPLSVDNAKLVDLAVTGNKIQDSTITTAKLANGIVTTEKLADNAVTTDKLAAGAVTLMNMGDNSIRTAAILNGAVTTTKIADGAVSSDKILDGAIVTSKIIDRSVTPDKLEQVYYTATQTDQQISTALSGGLPQDVIDQIIEQVSDISSGTVNTAQEDSIVPATPPSDVPPGIYVMRISEGAQQSWNDSTYFGYEDVVPVLLRTSHAGDKVVEEVFYQGPGWNVSYKRVSMTDTTWTGWRDDETTFGAQSKADAALASAKTFTQSYADEYTIPQFNAIVAGGYIPKERPSNILPNSSAEMGLQGWTNVGSASALFTAAADPTTVAPGLFICTSQTTTGGEAVLQSDSLSVTGPTVTLSADFITTSGGGGQIRVQLVRVSDNAVVATMVNDVTNTWHRKSVTASSVASGAYVVQIRIPSGLSGSSRRVRRITVASGADSNVWNQDANDKLLFQSVSDGKTAIAAAITGKGVVASGSDTHQQLATKVGQIQQGNYQVVSPSHAAGTRAVSTSSNITWHTTVATFPAGTKLISGIVTSSNVGPSTAGWCLYNIQNANNYAGFALRNSIGGIFVLVNLSYGSSNIYISSIAIDLVTKIARILYQSASGAGQGTMFTVVTLPANFDVSGALDLGWTSQMNSGASAGVFSAYCGNFQITSM